MSGSVFTPFPPERWRAPPRIVLARDSRGWYAALIRPDGTEHERTPDSHVQRRDACDDARDWARETGYKLFGV